MYAKNTAYPKMLFFQKHPLLFLLIILGFFFKFLLCYFVIYIFIIGYFYASHIYLAGNDIGDQAGAQLRYLVNLLFKITNRYIVFRYFSIQIFSNLALLVHRNDEQANFDKIGEA